MDTKDVLSKILTEISAQVSSINEEQLSQFKNAIIAAKHIFLAGTGRSGLID